MTTSVDGRPDIRLIAADLDGTLLTADKRLSDQNRAALERASRRGVLIVPATGRLFRGMPQAILSLPFLKYAITVNGASVCDVDGDRLLYRAELTIPRALEIMAWLDGMPVLYDCFLEGRGWMTAAMWDRLDRIAPNPFILDYMRSIRTPVPELKAFLRRQRAGVQKIQVFCEDGATRSALLARLPFPGLAVSASVANNVEINDENATKGIAMLALAERLGLRREQTLAFGDGLNDVDMLRKAGIGVAMANAPAEVRAAADLVTASNDADGVAAALKALGIV